MRCAKSSVPVWLILVMIVSTELPLAAQAEDRLASDMMLLLGNSHPTSDPDAVAAAWKRVVDTGPGALSPLMAAARKAKPVARNWLLSAADQIVVREHRAGRNVPRELILALLNDTENPPQGRWWAYQWLKYQDEGYAREILASFVNDPAAALRRAAIAAEIESLGNLKKLSDLPQDDPRRNDAIQKLRQLFDAARDRDQVEDLAQVLRQFGEQVDLRAHYGYITTWWFVGPFDNHEGAGFEAIYPPETQAARPDLTATYQGKHGPVTWKKVTTPDDHGTFDLNKILGEEKGVVAYAVASLVSTEEQPAEIRVATPNAIKVWGNGQLLGTFHVYHSGFEDDQYRLPWRLHTGANWIMIKICQNEQTQDWARFWIFRLRVCDELGGGVGRQSE
jgi:hypothetical protein